MANEEAKKGSIWKGILQFFIFFVILILCINWGEKSLWGVVLFEVAWLRYCFVSYKDKNLICDKAILGRLKNKGLWLIFIIVGVLWGWMMIGSYTGEGSERIRDFQEGVANSMEQGLDDVEQGIQDTTDDVIQELEEMK